MRLTRVERVQSAGAAELHTAGQTRRTTTTYELQSSMLISTTVNVSAGFAEIEAAFNKAAAECKGAQWQFANVYDPISGNPSGWWNRIQS